VDAVRALFITLAVLVALYVGRWWRALSRSRARPCGASERVAAPGPMHTAIGFVTNFFDTLGIGSFATTTTIYKLRKLVPDERIPGTMLVGHTLPVAAQAFAFISVVSVDRQQLIALILAMMAGGWLGAGTVSRLPRRVIQLGMAAALMPAGLCMAIGLMQLFPASLILFALLGMDPRAAFPGAFMGLVAAMRFLSTGRYAGPAALGLTLGGIPGVLVAVWLVRSLPLDFVRWGVIVVVLYTAMTLIRSAVEERRALAAAPVGAPAGA
jgi:uncharacterized membrane protein YfcA